MYASPLRPPWLLSYLAPITAVQRQFFSNLLFDPVKRETVPAGVLAIGARFSTVFQSNATARKIT